MRFDELFDPTHTSITSNTSRESIEQYWGKKLFGGPVVNLLGIFRIKCFLYKMEGEMNAKDSKVNKTICIGTTNHQKYCFCLCLEQEEKLNRSIGHCPTWTMIDSPLVSIYSWPKLKMGFLAPFCL